MIIDGNGCFFNASFKSTPSRHFELLHRPADPGGQIEEK